MKTPFLLVFFSLILMTFTGCDAPNEHKTQLGSHSLTIVDNSGKPQGGNTGTKQDDNTGITSHTFESANGRYKITLIDKVMTINEDKYTLEAPESTIRIEDEQVLINGVAATPDAGS